MKSNLFLIFLIVLGLSTNVRAQTLVISTPAIPPVSGENLQPGYLKNIIVAAGKRIGVDISFQHLPAKRSLITSNAGITHGELHRVEGLEKYYPNLIRVPEAVLLDQFVGFAAKPGLHIKDWSDTTQYTLYYPRGWTIYSSFFGHDYAHHPGNQGDILFKMVESGRIDIAMHTLDKGTYIAQQNNIKVYPVSPAFAIKPMYVYLHKSKANLVQPLANAIKSMKEDGSYDSIKRDVLYHYGLTNKAYFETAFITP